MLDNDNSFEEEKKENNMIRYIRALIGEFRLEQVELWLNIIRAHCFRYVRKLS